MIVHCLAGGGKGGAPHITIISRRQGGLARELVRRMSPAQRFSFRHVDLDSLDPGSGDWPGARGGWEHHILVIT